MATARRPWLVGLALALPLLGAGCQEDDYATIVFVHSESPSPRGDLYLVSWSGGAWTPLTDGGQDSNPRWSPGKDHIAFMRLVGTSPTGGGGHHDIYVIDPDGRRERALISGPAEEGYPAWSPDGTKIAFISDRDGPYALYVYDTAFGSVSRIDTGDVRPYFLGAGGPTWSPAGDRIAFRGIAPHGGDVVGIWSVAYPGGAGASIVLARDTAREPDWSPDSGRIVFSDAGAITVMNADGTGERVVPGARGDNPAWSVNFDEIVFDRTDGSAFTGSEIFRVEDDGRLLTRLTDNATWEFDPHF
jgi:TolB protein